MATTARPWFVVVLVGVVIELVVFGLQMFPRLNAGQDVLDDARPAFTEERVAGDRAGIAMVSKIVDTADPLVTRNGGGAGEVPKLIAFVSRESGLSQQQVLAALRKNFPHTTGLLQALPLADVTRELPGVQRLAPDLASTAPKLGQAVTNLPFVTRGWERVPGTAELTNFDGTPVRTVPRVRDYLAGDVVAAVSAERENFDDLDSQGGVGYLPPLLAVLGAIVIVFGLVMARMARGGGLSRGTAIAGWSVVSAVGALVIVLVLVLGLFGRLSSGDDLLDGLKPAFTEERVAGDRAGVAMVSRIVDTVDPLIDRGDAASEVSKLAPLAPRLRRAAPHTEALLRALPLRSVTSELPRLVRFLADTLDLSERQVNQALAENFPRLNQAIGALPDVTGGWNDVPGTDRFTRFDGEPVRTVPQVRDAFAGDVVPALERNREDFDKLESTWPPVTVFAPLLTVVGALVLVFGLAMLMQARRAPRRPAAPA